MSPSNEREHARLAALLRRVMEAAEARPRGGDHAELLVSWDGQGQCRGRMRGPLDLADTA